MYASWRGLATPVRHPLGNYFHALGVLREFDRIAQIPWLTLLAGLSIPTRRHGSAHPMPIMKGTFCFIAVNRSGAP